MCIIAIANISNGFNLKQKTKCFFLRADFNCLLTQNKIIDHQYTFFTCQQYSKISFQHFKKKLRVLLNPIKYYFIQNLQIYIISCCPGFYHYFVFFYHHPFFSSAHCYFFPITQQQNFMIIPDYLFNKSSFYQVTSVDSYK